MSTFSERFNKARQEYSEAVNAAAQAIQNTAEYATYIKYHEQVTRIDAKAGRREDDAENPHQALADAHIALRERMKDSGFVDFDSQDELIRALENIEKAKKRGSVLSAV